MKKNTILLIRVKKEIEAELEGIQKLKQEFTALPEGNPAYLLRAKGSIFHDFYSAAERIFSKIGEELNGGIPKSEQWHKELLFDMILDLETVRPPVINNELHKRLTIFLRFRHLFRNMYGYELKAEKISELENLFISTAEQFISEIKGFCAWLSEQADII